MTPLAQAWDDLCAGARAWPLWFTLGNHEILERYRRSVLGPWWITLSLGITVVALGVLYARILHQDLNRYLPYLTVGLIVWMFVSATVQEGSIAYIANEGILKQINLPRSIYLYRVIWRNCIVLAHNLAVFAVVAFWCRVNVAPQMLLAVPGFALLSLNLMWITLLSALLCTRFRDVPQIVGSVLQLAIFFTPIMWVAQPGTTLLTFAQWNPFFYAVELVRTPLVGGAVQLGPLLAAGATAIAGWAVAFLAFVRYRARITFWL